MTENRTQSVQMGAENPLSKGRTAALETALFDAFSQAAKGIDVREQALLEFSHGSENPTQRHLGRLLRTWYWQDHAAYAYAYVAATHSDLG